jgi:hypothetical protein
MRSISRVFAVLVIASSLSLAVSCSSSGGGGSSAPAATGDVGVQADPGGDPPDGGTPGGQSVTLAWDEPTQDEDGNPLEDLAGFIVHFGTDSLTYSSDFDVGNSSEVEIVDLDQGTYFFTVTAYDFFGNESDFSDEIAHTMQ